MKTNKVASKAVVKSSATTKVGPENKRPILKDIYEAERHKLIPTTERYANNQCVSQYGGLGFYRMICKKPHGKYQRNR
jgi:hypothetical protein